MDLGIVIILMNAVVLGIRHGVDWDHIAAIGDIVGTTANTDMSGDVISFGVQKNAVRLSTCYALGHATMVLILGLVAIMFAAALPEWIDPIMEKAVGVTLLALAAWIFYSLVRSTGDNLVMQSRWMFLFAKFRQVGDWFHCKLTGELQHKELTTGQYEAPTAFGIGLIHGFGAETGTQVLLIAAVGGSANHFLGACILLSFILGLLISNTLVAILSCAGFIGSSKFKPLMVTTSVLTGLFSLIVGLFFVSGCGANLPSLQR